MRLHYSNVSKIYIYSVIADVRLLRRAYTFIMYSVRCVQNPRDSLADSKPA